MPTKTPIKSSNKAKQKIPQPYDTGNTIEFYISEETATYEKQRPFTVYYDDPAHSVRLLKGDCIAILNQSRENSVDMVFVDSPYCLSNGGITCHAGRMVSVNKGKWDKSRGVEENHKFTLEWLKACQRILKPNGTIWVSGTTHIIYTVGFAMQQLGYKILNDIVWYENTVQPKHSYRHITNSTETFIWAAKNQKSKHYFDYQLMKKFNNGKQMRNLWCFSDEDKKETEPVCTVNGLKYFASIVDRMSIKKRLVERPSYLVKRILLASTKEGDLIFDPFCGNSTIGITASQLNRKYVGIMLKNKYLFNTSIPSEPFISAAIKTQSQLKRPVKQPKTANYPWD